MKEQWSKSSKKKVNINDIEVEDAHIFRAETGSVSNKCPCAHCACVEREERAFKNDEEITGK